jgi:hypothetical protein
VYTLRALDLSLPPLERLELIDVIANGEGRLVLAQDDLVIFEENLFPVVELARDLARWLKAAFRENYSFESMSFEDTGSIRVWEVAGEWVLSSDFADSVQPTAEPWILVQNTLELFVAEVGTRLNEAGWNAAFVLNSPYADDV